jgi:ATPase family protein associated with various cellular activities (AAA)
MASNETAFDSDFARQLLSGLKQNGLVAKNDQEKLRDEAMAALDRLGSLSVKDDSVRFEGDNLVLPQRFSGDLLSAARFLEEIHEAEEEETAFGRTFNFRPWDGAAAFQRALYRVFGTTGLGKAVRTMFGSRPPQLVSISVGPEETLQVPWGRVAMPPLNATFDLDTDWHEEYGMLFRVNVTAPKKQRRRIEAFFDVVQDELKERSIYKGRAFNGAEQPEFLDLTGIKEEKVVYAGDVLAQLNANLWSLIEHTDTMRELGIPLKRAVLLEGPYGTGKSLAGALTAQRAIANGWTFILARPGKDNVFDVLKTAQLYAPAVVQFEDIDTIAAEGTDKEISRLLDALDGISNKSNGVLALFTTNHVNKLQKGVMRPGRIDSIIHVADLDRDAIERLIKVTVAPEILSADVDYDEVFSHVTGFLPAFVTEAANRAVRYAVSRTGSKAFVIETADIVGAAIGLRAQHDLMNAAQEGTKTVVTINDAVEAAATKAINVALNERLDRATITDYDGDFYGKVKLKN